MKVNGRSSRGEIDAPNSWIQICRSYTLQQSVCYRDTPDGLDAFLCAYYLTPLLSYYGQIAVTEEWVRKMTSVFESADNEAYTLANEMGHAMFATSGLAMFGMRGAVKELCQALGFDSWRPQALQKFVRGFESWLPGSGAQRAHKLLYSWVASAPQSPPISPLGRLQMLDLHWKSKTNQTFWQSPARLLLGIWGRGCPPRNIFLTGGLYPDQVTSILS
jgi:hypothetical protein